MASRYDGSMAPLRSLSITSLRSDVRTLPIHIRHRAVPLYPHSEFLRATFTWSRPNMFFEGKKSCKKVLAVRPKMFFEGKVHDYFVTVPVVA
eukprot:scaffold82990_cov63-Attheya_sp.AAC.2